MRFSVKEFKGFDESNEGLGKDMLIKKITRLLESRETFLNDGSTSEVFTLKDNIGICIKTIDKERLKERGLDCEYSNPLEVEFDFLQKAYEANKSGVRIPKPYFYIHIVDEDTCNETKLLGMEKIKGVTLQEIYNGKYGVPQNFDQDIFFKRLKECLLDINNGGILHNDIAPSNIMIDLSDCTPSIIDFGEAKEINDLDTLNEDIRSLDEIDSEFIDNI